MMIKQQGNETYLPPPPREQNKKFFRGNSDSIHPYGRYGNAAKTSKTISTIAILWPVKAILEKRAATVEVDTFIAPKTRVTHEDRDKQLALGPPG